MRRDRDNYNRRSTGGGGGGDNRNNNRKIDSNNNNNNNNNNRDSITTATLNRYNPPTILPPHTALPIPQTSLFASAGYGLVSPPTLPLLSVDYYSFAYLIYIVKLRKLK